MPHETAILPHQAEFLAYQGQMMAIRGGIRCQPAGSLVRMFDGSARPIESIGIDARVLSPQPDGKMLEGRVKGVYVYHDADVYGIYTQGPKKLRRVMRCSLDHRLVLAYEKRWTEYPQGETSPLMRVVRSEQAFCNMTVFDWLALPNRKRSRYRLITANGGEQHAFHARHIGKATVYGFTIDTPSRWYITDDNIITHNSGKSHIIANWMHDRMEMYPDGGHFAVGADLPQLKRGFLRTFTSRMESYGIAYDYLSTTGTVILKHNGARLEALSAEISERIRSSEMDSVLLEEPQTWQNGLETYRVVVGRLSGSPGGKKYRAIGMQPQLRMSFNPTAAGSWIWELIERQRVMPCLQYSVRKNYLMPNYKEYIALQESQLPPALWPVELDGEWGTAGGQVYRYYSRENHAVPLEGLPPLAFDPTLPLCWSLDFNVARMCSVIFQIHHQRKKVVGYNDAGLGFGLQQRKPIVECEVKGAQEKLFYYLAEMKVADCSVYQLIPIFLERFGEWAKRAGVRLYGDSTGGSRGQQTLETNWEIVRSLLTNAGIRVEFCVTTNPLEGDRVNAANAQMWSGDGIGLFIDHDRCRELVKDLQVVQFKENTNVIDKISNPDVTHMSDAFSYPIASERKKQSQPDVHKVAQQYSGFMGT